jgi:hypothetical protein
MEAAHCLEIVINKMEIKIYDTVSVLRNGKLHLIITTQKVKIQIQNLCTELAGVSKLNQVGLDKLKNSIQAREKNSAFLFAEIGLGQAEQHLLWPHVYTLLFVCLALVVKYYLV